MDIQRRAWESNSGSVAHSAKAEEVPLRYLLPRMIIMAIEIHGFVPMAK